jgi:hypothetical protein
LDKGGGAGKVRQDHLGLGGPQFVHAAAAGRDRDDERTSGMAGLDVAWGVPDEGRGPLVERRVVLPGGASACDSDEVGTDRVVRPVRAPSELVADGFEPWVSGTVDDHDRLVRLLLADKTQHPAEQVERLVDDRDDHADRRPVGSGPRLVATRQQDLDGPLDPDGGDEHGEEVQRLATHQRVTKLQKEREQRRRPFPLAC